MIKASAPKVNATYVALDLTSMFKNLDTNPVDSASSVSAFFVPVV